jgi:hypothetical protein
LTDGFIVVSLNIVPNYNEMIAELQEELTRLVAERDKIGEQVEALIKAMNAIKVLALRDDSAQPISTPVMADDSGFTDKIRSLLKANPARSFTAVEVRDVLLEFDKYADAKVLLIHTHNTLKRLHKQSEVEEVAAGSDGRTSYRWKGINVGDAVISFLEVLQGKTLTGQITADLSKKE